MRRTRKEKKENFKKKVGKRNYTNRRIKKLKGGSHNKTRRIYVLFLAHEGVQQMEIWKKWRETGTNKGNIIFVVADESGRTSENSEENIYCVTKELVTSSWYSVEIVINTLYLFQRAVELQRPGFRDGDLFWLVSGYCLPIIGSDKLTPFGKRANAKIARSQKVHNGCVCQENVDKICTLTEGEILSIKQEVDASLPREIRGTTS